MNLKTYLSRAFRKYQCNKITSFIFVANTGRAGSTSLTKIFSTIPKVISFHEATPDMSGTIMKEYNNNNNKLLDEKFKQEKLPNIYYNARNSSFYIESNHLFIKTFSDLAVQEFGCRLKVIYLHRDKLEVASSYYNRHIINKDVTVDVNDWVLDPSALKNLLKIDDVLYSSTKFNNLFFRFLWYCYEIEARTVDFCRKHPSIPVIGFNTNELNSFSSTSKLLNELDIPVPNNLLDIIGTNVNQGTSKSDIPDGISLSSVNKFSDICKTRLIEKKLNWIIK